LCQAKDIPTPDSSYLQDLLKEGYHSDEDVDDEVGEEDAVANMATEIEHEISKNKALSALPFHDNSKKFADPLIWWRKTSHISQSFHALHESIFAFQLQRLQMNAFSIQHLFFEKIEKPDGPRTCW
jgi:hypothetical protein